MSFVALKNAVCLVGFASYGSKQAQLEANYLLASRSLVKCLLV